MRILFLASGNGGTMKFVHHAIKELKLDAEIVGVISDRECGSIEYARNNGILVHTFNPWREKTGEIVETIKSFNPDYVVTNIFKILSKEIFTCCKAQFINLHYSLLPAFGGVIGFKTLKMAKEANSQIIGATCHYVTEEVDGGKIISQAAIPVDWNEQFDAIGDKIFRIACEAFLNGLLVIDNKDIGGSKCSNVIYSPQLRYDNSIFTESFWALIKNT